MLTSATALALRFCQLNAICRLKVTIRCICCARFKQLITDVTKLRLSETLLGFSKVLPLIEYACLWCEIIVVGGGAKAIALRNNMHPDHPQWQGTVTATKDILHQRGFNDEPDYLLAFHNDPPLVRIEKISNIYKMDKEIVVDSCALWEKAVILAEQESTTGTIHADTMFPAARLDVSSVVVPAISPDDQQQWIPVVEERSDGLPFPKPFVDGYTDQWAQVYLHCGAPKTNGSADDSPKDDDIGKPQAFHVFDWANEGAVAVSFDGPRDVPVMVTSDQLHTMQTPDLLLVESHLHHAADISSSEVQHQTPSSADTFQAKLRCIQNFKHNY